MERPLDGPITTSGARYVFQNARTDKEGYLLPIQQTDAERLALGLSDPRLQYSRVQPVTPAHVQLFVAHTRAEALRIDDFQE
jgi:hypothetical protein